MPKTVISIISCSVRANTHRRLPPVDQDADPCRPMGGGARDPSGGSVRGPQGTCGGERLGGQGGAAWRGMELRAGTGRVDGPRAGAAGNNTDVDGAFTGAETSSWIKTDKFAQCKILKKTTH